MSTGTPDAAIAFDFPVERTGMAHTVVEDRDGLLWRADLAVPSAWPG